jgi:hypothetical protein
VRAVAGEDHALLSMGFRRQHERSVALRRPHVLLDAPHIDQQIGSTLSVYLSSESLVFPPNERKSIL